VSTFLAYTPPAAGHVYPLAPGLLELQRRGHRVHVRTSPSLAEQLRAAGLTAEPVDPRIIAALGRPGDEPETMTDLLARGSYEMTDLADAISTIRPDVVLADTNTYGANTAAEASGLPWMTTLPSLLPMPGKGIPPYGLGLAPMPGPVGAVRDKVLWKLVEKVYGRRMLPGLDRLRADARLASLSSPLDYFRRADRLLVLTGPPLEYPRPNLPGHVRMVGGQLWDPPAPTPEWLLEDGDPWVLVTCSTHYQADEALAVAAVQALRDEPVRILVTLADAYDATTLPEAKNLRVERFIAHAPVLAHSAAVVCPSGMGIVQKSIAAGVPIVAVPYGRDQPEVARRVVESGAGVLLPKKRLDADRLREAVRQAISMRSQVKAATAALDAAGAADRFADAAEELAPALR